MIKNITFDFGNVLAHFDPYKMVRKHVKDEADAMLLEEVVYDRAYWDELDRGSMTNEETAAAYRTRLPERLWETADSIFYNWIYDLPEMEGMRELIVYLKKRYGVRTFLLSNISKYFAEHEKEIPILELIDGCVFSGPIGKVKPNRDIYEHLCEKYGLLPAETVFVDDRSENVDAAAAIGIHGYLFDGDAEKLRGYLDNLMQKQ